MPSGGVTADFDSAALSAFRAILFGSSLPRAEALIFIHKSKKLRWPKISADHGVATALELLVPKDTKPANTTRRLEDRALLLLAQPAAELRRASFRSQERQERTAR